MSFNELNPKFVEMSDATLATAWTQACEELDHYKKAESELRDEIVARFFHVPDSGQGTVSRHFPNGVLKAAFKLNHKVDPEKAAKLFADLEEKADPLLSIVEQTLVYKPEFKATGFKMLPPLLQSRVKACVTSTTGKPTLEFVPVKV